MPQNVQKLQSGVTQFQQLYGILNNWLEAISSQYSGASFPANPITGQPCFRTDMSPPRLYYFTGDNWTDAGESSAATRAASAEITAARGEAASMAARLGVALNPDGTLKGTAPASDWWNAEPDPVQRESADVLTVSGDKRHIYTPRRALLCTFADNSQLRTWVAESSYDAASGRTSVTVNPGGTASAPTLLEFGQPLGNEPKLHAGAGLTVEADGLLSALAAAATTRGLGRIAVLADMAPGAAVANGPAFLSAGGGIVRATPAANAVPQAGASGQIYRDWLPEAYVGYKGAVALAAHAANSGAEVVQAGAFAAGFTAAAGWQRLQGGMILQFGAVSVPHATTTLVTFPLSFPSACNFAACSLNTASGIVGGNTAIIGLSKNNMSLYQQTSVAQVCYWFATGY